MIFGKPKTPLTPEQQLQRRQNVGVGLAALSETLRGGDPVGRTMQLQQQLQPQAKKLPNSYQEYLLTDTTPTAEEYSTFLNRGSSPGNLLQVIDSAGNFVTNISKKGALAQTEELAKKGFRLTQLPTGTEAAPTGEMTVEKKLQPIIDQYRTGTNLINEISNLAENVYKNPEAANKLVAGGVNAIEFLKANVKGFENIAKENKDNPVYQLTKETQTSLTGTDFSNKISEVSGGSAIIQSQILDLAFLFAAARGQSGRGLSDRDFQNALDIISKGVNAEQKVSVMQDISRRITNEYNTTIDIARRLNAVDEQVIGKLEQFSTLPPFVNPYITVQTQTPTPTPTSNIQSILNKYPPQG
jgi:hypothetical protein